MASFNVKVYVLRMHHSQLLTELQGGIIHANSIKLLIKAVMSQQQPTSTFVRYNLNIFYYENDQENNFSTNIRIIIFF